MLLAISKYLKTGDALAELLPPHRAFLDECYKQGALIFSGPLASKKGGILLAKLATEEEFKALLARDPLVLEKAAQYDIIEFTPSKYDQAFAALVK